MIKPVVEKGKVVFGPCRLSYTHVFEKWAPDGASQEDGKYMTNILIDKNDKETVKAIKEAIEQAKKSAIVSKWKGIEPKKIDSPLRNGDEKENDNDNVYADHYYVNAKSAKRPGVVDRDKSPITDEDEFYSGVWAIVSVTFYGYDFSGKKGIACGLNNLMKYKDDERFGGGSSAESDFADIVDDDDDDDL